ncbi:prepilin-type N-terminal cleavage/methylation domain-containing protein [bacterium]|nr:prepilin-type N-terminal cleavage/methylation domain-containing protein [bacterium]
MYRKNGFTILELVVGVAIVSLLAAVSISSYQKYVKRAKEAEGYIMLRKIVDSELAFAASPLYTNQSGQTCRFYTGFIQVKSYHEDNNNNNWYSALPPKGKKSDTISFYGRDMSANTVMPNQLGHCAAAPMVTGYGLYDAPQLLNLGDSYQRFASNSSLLKSDYLEPGYFLYTATKSNSVAAETGYQHAYMVQAIADLDGVSPDSGIGAMEWLADINLSKTYYTILARGIYIDANGEPKAQPGIYKQREQAYSAASYESSTYYGGGSSSNNCDYLEEVYGIDYCNKYY